MRARPLFARCRRSDGWGRAWLGVMLALALATRLLVPQGWMPGSDGGLMLCSGTAMPAASMAHHPGKHQPPAGQRSEHPCAFAGMGVAAAAPPPVALAMPAMPPAFVAPQPHGMVTIGHGLAAPPPPQTGPPAFA